MKFLSWILSLSILMGISSPAFATDATGVESALEIVKERIEIGDFGDFESSYETDTSGKTTYYFHWSEKNDEDYEYISVGYSDGVILSYDRSFNGEYDKVNGFGKHSLKDAKKTAENFIKKTNPDCFTNIKLIENDVADLNESSYYFRLIRTENGVPVIGQSGNIAVSKNTNEVRYFHINYGTGLEFLNTDAIISKSEAKEAYSQKLAPKLQYSYYYDYKTKELTVYPEYVSAESNLVINALDANVYEIPEIAYNYALNASKEMAADEARGLSAAEIKEISNISGLLSEAEAEKKIRENDVISLSSTLKLSSVSLERDYINNEKYIYNFRFSNEGEYAYITMNAKTGDILSFNKNGKYPEKQNQSIENEKKTADAALKELAGEKYFEFRIEESKDTGSVKYIRTKDGIDVNGDYASFAFDGEDNLIRYNMNYTDIKEFPQVEGVLSEKEAFYKACDILDFGLSYSIDYEAKEAVPVFSFVEDGNIDTFKLNPFTGRLIDYKGDDIEETDLKYEYSDIENHYAKEIFLKLSEFKIGFGGGKLEPDRAITQSEYLSLLNEVFGYSAEIDEIYQRFISRGTIKKEDRADNSVVLREQAAILMIREMGAEEFAKYEDIYVSPFADVTENKGYIALLKAMGVVSGDTKGNFNPKRTITRGEALIIIYNYLNR